MKHFYTLFLFAVLSATVAASETSDKFAQYLPGFSAQDGKVREEAQQGWQNVCLASPETRSESVKLMLEQLGKENPVETTVWLLRQLGYTAGNEAVPVITKFMGNSEKRVADEAARALGRIPGTESAAALNAANSKLSKDVTNDRNLNRSILKEVGNEKEMPMALFAAETGAVADWMKKYDELSDYEKSLTLAALTARKDKKYLPQAVAALESKDGYLLKAGLLAVEAFGGTQEIPILLEQVFQGENKDLAKLVLSRMTDANFDKVLLDAFNAEKDNGRFEVLADVLSRRYNADIRPILLERAEQSGTSNRLALMRIAESLSSKEQVGDFVDVWMLITDRGQKDQAEQIIARLCDGDAAPVLAKQTAANELMLMSLLGRIGDEKTLPELRKIVLENKSAPEKFLAAFNALRNWPDARVADDLYKIVENKDFDAGIRVNALRSFVRVLSLPNDRIKIRINDQQKVERLVKTFDFATRADEKRLIIERVGQIRTVDSLKFVLKFFDDAELQDRVIRSVLDLTHHTDLRRSDRALFTNALDKVLATTKDQGLLNRAQQYKDNF